MRIQLDLPTCNPGYRSAWDDCGGVGASATERMRNGISSTSLVLTLPEVFRSQGPRMICELCKDNRSYHQGLGQATTIRSQCGTGQDRLT
eukprot:1394502-Amphidinium_carterae.2